MPRQARIDIPGQAYHIMSRGIERRAIFLDEKDYSDFRDRIGIWLRKSGGKCLAWVLMPNHFHLLVLRGAGTLSDMMHHAMTGYAINFNLRHNRAGHLFQNRYKAIICDLEKYLLELVPYIHLNPLRARLVKNLTELAGYKWCGHRSALGCVSDDVLDRAALLANIGENEKSALAKYKLLMAEKSGAAVCPDFEGGGRLRSIASGPTVLRVVRAGEKSLSDQRILGESEFVESILRSAGEAAGKKTRTRAEILNEIEKSTGIAKADILRPSRARKPAYARAIYCCRCKDECGSSGTELKSELGINQGAVSKLIAKGRALLSMPPKT